MMERKILLNPEPAAIGTIVEENEVYFYFEMLNNIGGKRILDAGMFLKRIGAVSRQAMDCEIPESVQLYGIDLFPETGMAVYRNIYDEILTGEQFFGQPRMAWKHHHFDTAVLLETEACLSEEESGILWNYVLQNAESVMADTMAAQKQMRCKRIRAYYRFTVGTENYAWIPLSEFRGECK